MSFQDMGKKGSRAAAATQQSYSARPAAPSSGNSPLAQISENLNQYQVSPRSEMSEYDTRRGSGQVVLVLGVFWKSRVAFKLHIEGMLYPPSSHSLFSPFCEAQRWYS